MRSSEDRIDKSIAFKPVNIAVMTVSDSRTLENDRSGDLLKSRIIEDGHILAARVIVADEQLKIIAKLTINDIFSSMIFLLAWSPIPRHLSDGYRLFDQSLLLWPRFEWQ